MTAKVLLTLSVLLNFILPEAHSQPQETAQPPLKTQSLLTLQRVCSECHALEVMGNCLSGDCSTPRTMRVAEARPWDMVLDRMKGRGAKFNEGERHEILTYLQTAYPAKLYPLAWKQVGAFEPGGWNVTTMREHTGFLYAGFEGNGKIFRTSDSLGWQEVINTNQYTVYGITPYKKLLYAGAAEPEPQIWRSADGLQWQKIATLPAEDVGIYALGVFKSWLYAGSGRSWIYRSHDGAQWEKIAALKGNVPTIFSNWMRFLFPFKGYLYAGMEIGALYRSADGIHWTPANLKVEGNDGFRGVADFKGALYVGTTRSGEIWKTTDGKKWRRVFKPTRNSPAYVGSMAVVGEYLFAGMGGYVYRTKDGLNWAEVGHLSPYSLEAMSAWRGDILVGASTTPTGFIYQANPLRTNFIEPK